MSYETENLKILSPREVGELEVQYPRVLPKISKLDVQTAGVCLLSGFAWKYIVLNDEVKIGRFHRNWLALCSSVNIVASGILWWNAKK